MLCPCGKYKNKKFAHSETVWKNLVYRWFIPQYYILFQHEEGYSGNKPRGSSHFENVCNSEELCHLHNETAYHHDQMVDHDKMHDLDTHAFLETTSTVAHK